jgi:hypothetical protein
LILDTNWGAMLPWIKMVLCLLMLCVTSVSSIQMNLIYFFLFI